jgi:hypothetical protein
MKMKKQTVTLLAVAAVVYHLAAVAKDGEQWMVNARRARANPTLGNLAGLLLASGVLLTDLSKI